ncbi:hypothetical protein AFGD_002582 [Aspergillus flavus]|nr:hypothetical protein AFGD_002582 [Aspergillus flavus]
MIDQPESGWSLTGYIVENPQDEKDVNPHGGCSITNHFFRDDVIKYCCGTPIGNGTNTNTTVCPENKTDFFIDDAKPVLGHAMLANVTSLSASSNNGSNGSVTCPVSSPCHEIAVRTGVGVSLGVVALGAIAWAVYERVRANRLKSSAAVMSPNMGMGLPTAGSAPGYQGHTLPVELAQDRQVVEIMEREI